MRMAKLSLERIKELDQVRDREVKKCLKQGLDYGHPTPFIFDEEHEDYPWIAKRWGVPVQEFLTYARVREFVLLSAHGRYEDLPDPWKLAEDLGISAEQFNDYLHEEIRLVKEAFEDASLRVYRDAS